MKEEQKDFTIYFPKRTKSSEYYIDETFKKEILLHIIKNNMRNINPSLILAVQGNKGEGKTSHILEICKSLEIVVVFIHGSYISGQHERQPVDLITNAYLEASHYKSMSKLSVLMIDDIDTSVASTIDDRKYTANSQLVNGVLMSIANNPHRIGDTETHRIPIIFTGNDLTNLYAPLTRNGRMKIFSWEPNVSTKVKIINYIFKHLIDESEEDKFQKIIQDYINKPISFFCDIKNGLYDDFILNIVHRDGKVTIAEIDNELSSMINNPISLDIIKEKAEAIFNSTLKNYN